MKLLSLGGLNTTRYGRVQNQPVNFSPSYCFAV
jgi:hypothetical protein